VQAYTALVDDAPTDVPPRVNLGLALIKARRFPEAIRQLAIVVDLNPDHKKAMGYLGLAHLESSDPATARGWFERAGSLNMVARCDELMARAREPVPREEPEPAVETVEAAPPPPVEPPPPAPIDVAPAPEPAVEQVVEPAVEPPAPELPAVDVEVAVSEASPEPSPAPEPAFAPLASSPATLAPSFAIEAVEAEPAPAASGPEGLGAFAAQRTVRPARDVFAV
jgi:outer membrane biosynthesis protein TonB